ncbi:MAG: hypothetical protein RXO34_00580 [Nitrososphaeria archaeon]
MVYNPAEDTYFLLDNVKNINGRVLELGCGSCYVLSNINSEFKVGCDLIKPDSLKDDVEFILGDCRKAPFRNGSFEQIIFNPPYLPSDKIIDITVDGGKGGVEIALKFLIASLRIVKKPGRIYFILSSLSDYRRVENFLNKKGLKFVKKQKELFFETLYLYIVSNV